MRLNLFACLTFAVSLNCLANPVILDTPDATVMIVRPIDQWSGNKRFLDISISGLQKKCFLVVRKDENIEKSLVERIKKESADLGFEQCYTGSSMGGYIMPSPPISVLPSEMATFNKVQEYLFKASVLLQGNPATLQDRIANKQSIGSVVEFLAFAIASKVGASNGISPAGSLNLGLLTSSGIGQYPLDSEFRIKSENIPLLNPVPMDYAKYKSVEVRKIESWPSKNSNGEIIIGYKKEKTLELEEDLLVKSYIIAGGLNEVVPDIELARKNDYEDRLKIWNDCVAKGECKDD